MTRPTNAQASAAAAVLADDWDRDGGVAGGDARSYAEWGFGIADMIANEAPHAAMVEYLGVLEQQLGVPISSPGRREAIAARLETVVRAQTSAS